MHSQFQVSDSDLRDEIISLAEVSIAFQETPSTTQGQHIGQFHLPRCFKMSILFPQQVARNASRQIICNARATQLDDDRTRCSFFNDTHQCYNPLLHLVLFPHGTNGYHYNLCATVVANNAVYPRMLLLMYVRFNLMNS